jgi:hypothetical protein
MLQFRSDKKNRRRKAGDLKGINTQLMVRGMFVQN